MAYDVTGYRHPEYAKSLSFFGEPYQLSYSGGWVLIRDIPGTPYRDAMGLYPLFSCEDWDALSRDLETLEGLVSLVLVVDPMANRELSALACFDLLVSYKRHYVVNLAKVKVSKHHQRNVRKAKKAVQVYASTGSDWLDDWISLYQQLVRRHDIEGIARFSRESFEKQFAVPGFWAFQAVKDGVPVAMILWYAQGLTAYYHLGASSEEGYKAKASFALFQASIDFFSRNSRTVNWLNLGAGQDGNGLSRFKEGWATDIRTAWLCGKILDEDVYYALARKDAGFFPAYRTWP